MDQRWISVILIFVFLLALITVSKLMRGKKSNGYSYRRQQKLLSPAEFKLYHELIKQLPHHIVMCKVRLADVLTPDEKGKIWQYAFNRIRSKHLDFVVIDPKDSRIVAGIELDDSTHRKPKRRERDEFLDSICEVAGLPLYRCKTGEALDVTNIQDLN